MSDTPAQAEATGDTIEFEFFDRKWHVPSKVRLSHHRKLQANPSNVGIVDTFLPADEIAALNEIDPVDADLDKFTDEIVRVQGFKNAGNS